MTCSLRIFFVCMITLALSATALAGPAAIDLKALADTGAKTAEKLRVTPAAWRVESPTVTEGAVLAVSVVNGGGKRKITLSMMIAGKETEIVRIISRDGLWYVTARGGSAVKCRPYEAELESPGLYLAIERAEPQFVTSMAQLADCTFESADDKVATFRQPVSRGHVARLQGKIGEIERVRKILPYADAEADENRLKKTIAEGTQLRVDRLTGQIIESGLHGNVEEAWEQRLQSKVTDFHFVSRIDSGKEFAVLDRDWDDRSDDPTAGNLDDLIMIGHLSAVHPNTTIEARLVDVTTGRFRRIPFRGGWALPGCFLKDRRSVIVAGLDSENASMRPYRVDLRTGKSDALGGPLLDSGSILSADLSPDGKTLAVMHMNPEPQLDGGIQTFVIDLASGNGRLLAANVGGANWTADGQHLIVQGVQDSNKRGVDSIAIIDLVGKITEICRGTSPTLLADRQTVLFRGDGALWRTCDMRGQNQKLYADGLKNYAYPTPAPDGKRLLMLNCEAGRRVPVLLPIGKSSGVPISDPDGTWASPPVWR